MFNHCLNFPKSNTTYTPPSPLLLRFYFVYRKKLQYSNGLWRKDNIKSWNMFLEEKLIINAFFSTSQNKKQHETQSLKKIQWNFWTVQIKH